MNAKTGKDWSQDNINDMECIVNMMKAPGFKLFTKHIEERISKIDKLSNIDYKELEKESLKRLAKHEAYTEIKNFFIQKEKEYNLYLKVKESKNGRDDN